MVVERRALVGLSEGNGTEKLLGDSFALRRLSIILKNEVYQ